MLHVFAVRLIAMVEPEGAGSHNVSRDEVPALGPWRLHLHGPVRLVRGAQVQTPPIKRLQALLVLLAVDGPQARGRVAAWLWPDLPETASRRNLRRELARLRELGLGDVVVSDADWLRLAALIEPAEGLGAAPASDTPGVSAEPTDPAPFRPFAEGLDLEDAPDFSAWLDRERERARGQWRSALRARAEALESAGQDDAATAVLQRLLEDEPLDEALHVQAMRLLARGGRRDAALARYERLRHLLGSELGLEPMPSTQALAAALREPAPSGLDGIVEPQAAPPSGAPGTGPLPQLPAQLPFVGRAAEVAALEGWWQAGPGLAWLEGEGGIGKSRLAADFVAAHGTYARVACRPDDRRTPYATMARALRALGADTPGSLALPAAVLEEVGPVLWPDTGARPGPRRPRTATLIPSTRSAQARLHEALTLAWHRMVGGTGDDHAPPDFDAVLIDDFHLADEASQGLLTEMARTGPGTRLLWLFRGEELAAPARAGLERLAAGATPAPVALRLQPLDGPAVLGLVRQLAGAAEASRFSQRLEHATAGNPLFLAETLRHLVESGQILAGPGGNWRTPYDDATADYAELPVPPSVEAAVQARAARLPAPTQRLLEAACLAAEPFDAGLLAGACACSEVEALQALEPAIDARLLREAEGGGHSFVHDRIAESVRHGLKSTRRRLLHRRLALAAEEAGAEPALVAAHLEAGGDPARAVRFRVAAAERAGRLHSASVARAEWEQALANGPTAAERVAILPRAAISWRQAGLADKVQQAIVELDALRGTAAEPRLAVEASVQAAYLCVQVNRAHEVPARLEALVAAGIADARLRLRAAESLALAWTLAGRHDDAARLVATSLADPEAQPLERAQLWHAETVGHIRRGDQRAALHACERQLELILALGDRRREAQSRNRIGILAEQLGDRARALVELDLAQALAGALGIVEAQRESLRALGDIAIYEGDPDRALACSQRAAALAAQFSRAENEAANRLIEHHARRQRGELGAALDAGRAALDVVAPLVEADGRRNVVAHLADTWLALGDRASAQALLDSVPLPAEGPIDYFATAQALTQAEAALQAGETAIVRHWLGRISAQQVAADTEYRCRRALLQAGLALGEGDAAQVLLDLVDTVERSPTVTLRARGLTLAWQALALSAQDGATATAGGSPCQPAGSALPPPWAAWTASLLASGRTPVLEVLGLRLARSRHTLAVTGSADAATTDELRVLGERLAASFGSHVEAAARWRDHLARLGLG